MSYTRIIGDLIVSGPIEILDEFSRINQERRELESRSKYHVGEEVRVTYDIDKIVSKLYPVYTLYDARMIARRLAGSTVEILSVDTLTDDSGNPGTYYTIEDEYGMIYNISENMISRDTDKEEIL